MSRQIAASAVARCPMSVATAYAQSFLRLAEAGGPEARVFAGPLRRSVRMTFGSSIDTTEPGRVNEQLQIRWSGRTTWLPDFAGTLHFRIASIQTTMLMLNGSYAPPGGRAGAIFDALLGKRIAQATANDFVRRIAAELERSETEWQEHLERHVPPRVVNDR